MKNVRAVGLAAANPNRNGDARKASPLTSSSHPRHAEHRHAGPHEVQHPEPAQYRSQKAQLAPARGGPGEKAPLVAGRGFG